VGFCSPWLVHVDQHWLHCPFGRGVFALPGWSTSMATRKSARADTCAADDSEREGLELKGGREGRPHPAFPHPGLVEGRPQVRACAGLSDVTGQMRQG
jgi:hypothetical protein